MEARTVYKVLCIYISVVSYNVDITYNIGFELICIFYS